MDEDLVHVMNNGPKLYGAACGAVADSGAQSLRGSNCLACWIHYYGEEDGRRNFMMRHEDARTLAESKKPPHDP